MMRLRTSFVFVIVTGLALFVSSCLPISRRHTGQ